MSDKPAPLILAECLHKSFGDVTAVDRVSLRVEAGEIYGLVGPDSAGKTTTIRILCGALQPTRLSNARVEIAGVDMLANAERARANIGYLPQRFSLYEELTVMENIRFFAEMRGLPTREWLPRCMEILRFVGLDEYTTRRAGHLSGGMKQKLGLAAALVHSPKVLLLDEPTTGVDPVTRQDFWQLIIHLVADPQRHVSVLVSTPYMDEATRCHRLGFLRSGRMLVEGSPTELRRLLDGRVLELSGAPLSMLRRLAQEDPGVEDVQMFGDRLHLRVALGESGAVMDRLRTTFLARGLQISRLRQSPPQLEDVFMSLIAKEGGGGSES